MVETPRHQLARVVASAAASERDLEEIGRLRAKVDELLAEKANRKRRLLFAEGRVRELTALLHIHFGVDVLSERSPEDAVLVKQQADAEARDRRRRALYEQAMRFLLGRPGATLEAARYLVLLLEAEADVTVDEVSGAAHGCEEALSKIEASGLLTCGAAEAGA